MACEMRDPDDCELDPGCVTISGRNLYDDGAGGTYVDWDESMVALGCMSVETMCTEVITHASSPVVEGDLSSCMWFPSGCIPEGWESCTGALVD
jgi:hypothetical protein